MKYFFAKIGYPNMPEEIQKLDRWSPARIKWEDQYHAEQCVMVQNPNNIELPDLTKAPAWKNWDILRDTGWFHRAVEGVSQLDSNGRLRSFTEDDYLIWVKPETDEELFETWMMEYDWYYEMSDDYRVYNAGSQMDNKLRNFVRNSKTLTPKQAAEIWNQYAPPNGPNFRKDAPSREITEQWFR